MNWKPTRLTALFLGSLLSIFPARFTFAQESPSFFPLMAWVSQPNEVSLKQMADCGITLAAFVHLRHVNLQVKKLAPILLSLKSRSVYHFKEIPKGCRGRRAGDLIEALAGNCLVGEFMEREGWSYVMIVNKDLKRSVPCEPQWAKRFQVQMISSYTGNATEFSDEQRWLAPGQGILLRLKE